MRTCTVVIIGIVALVALGGGIAVAVSTAGQSGAQPAPSPPPTSAADEHGDHDVLVPIPTTTPDLDAAATAATDALQAYARQDLGYAEWFAQLRPHLHDSAVDAYATVDPANIPDIVLTGGAETAPTSSDTYAVVYIPTTIGEYTIELRRADPATSWGVTRMQPPT